MRIAFPPNESYSSIVTTSEDAMEVRKRTEITVETNEVVTIRRARVYRAWCAECGEEVEMVRLPDARAIAGFSGAAMCPAKWHVQEAQDSTLVCMESLLRSM